MSLPRYSKYKDSGAKWLGVVPEHWEISVLKRMAHTELSNIDKKTAEGETSVRLCNYLDVYRNQTITANLDFMAASASVEQIARLSLRQGDVIITKDSETPDDIGIPALVAENMDGVVCGYHLALLRMYSRVADGSYMARALQSAFLHAQFSTSAVGITRFALGKYKIENAIVPKPTIEEQMEIAAFLDRETGKIDALVEEQRRLIELLKEKRQAVISHAVTKGLNPNVPMKDSGKDWIGEVPSHWEVLKFTREVKTVEGQVDPKVEPYSSMNLIGPEHVESKTGRLIELATVLEQSAESGKYLCLRGHIVYSKIRPALGKVVIAPEDCLCSADMYPFDGIRKVQNQFLFWLLLSAQFVAWSVLEADRVAMPKINRETFRKLHIPVPPQLEQGEIAEFLNAATADADNLIAEADRTIELLQERRSALISAAVTGQIDVRSHRPQEASAICQ